MVASRAKTLTWKALWCRQWLYFWPQPSFWTLTPVQASGLGAVDTLLCFRDFLLQETQRLHFIYGADIIPVSTVRPWAQSAVLQPASWDSASLHSLHFPQYLSTSHKQTGGNCSRVCDSSQLHVFCQLQFILLLFNRPHSRLHTRTSLNCDTLIKQWCCCYVTHRNTPLTFNQQRRLVIYASFAEQDHKLTQT